MESEQESSSSDQAAQRKNKLNSLLQKRIYPYPRHFAKKDTVKSILEKYFPNRDSVLKGGIQTAGRVVNKRPMGKAGFLQLADQTGSLQIYTNNKLLSEEDFFVFQQTDIGDIIGIQGEPFLTKTNEPSVKVRSFTILSKNLSPIPIVKEKEGQVYDAFTDIEARYRKRYVDLIVNKNTREEFIKRSLLIKHLRDFLSERGFLEVETPMLQTIASGAAAKPFETYHNTLGIPLFLRIAPELYLKRLIVGGFEKVFELNRNFRNEGISPKHNPEFTMIELYQAYSDYNDMMSLVEDIFEYLADKLSGSQKIIYGEHTVDFKKPWKRKTYLDAVKEETDIDFTPFLTKEKPDTREAMRLASSLKIDLSQIKTFWEVVDAVFSTFVEPKLIQPVFITHYPKAVSPFAKTVPKEEHLVERFEPYIAGREIGNAFTELNDPIEQKKRFMQQLSLKEEGAEETIPLDEDYLEALKVGMPPTGGLGLGIDRMAMLFMNHKSIKDVILFPTLRPK